MILRDKVLAQLHNKLENLRNFNDSLLDEAQVYREALKQLAQTSQAELTENLNGHETPGAQPTAEFDTARDLRFAFAPHWNNHTEARVWACETLLNQTTFAVDGSQINPNPDLSIPIAAVQVAWFENHHTHEGSYVKDAVLEIIPPKDFSDDEAGEEELSRQMVNLRRFRLEIEILCGLMKKHASAVHTNHLPVALFDGSLVISFADRLQEKIRRAYIESVLGLLRCSEQTGIPLVGYIDNSRARDLTNMIEIFPGARRIERTHDAELVNHLLQWGDRTPFFICARGSADRKQEGVLESFGEYKRGIGFVYIKTSSATPPARLEIPMWVYEQGLLDKVVDIIRAEVIVGNGYPYAIETADEAAVITTRDRLAFEAIFQRFAEEQGIPLRISSKAVSKSRRRYN